MRAWLLELSEQVGCRLRRHGLKGRTVQLKVRFEDFHTITRAQTLPQPTNVTQEIWQTAAQMFAERLPARRLHIRLLGVGMSGFDHPALVQLSLFPEAEHERQSRLDEVADQIKEKFGQAVDCSEPWGCCTTWSIGRGRQGLIRISTASSHAAIFRVDLRPWTVAAVYCGAASPSSRPRGRSGVRRRDGAKRTSMFVSSSFRQFWTSNSTRPLGSARSCSSGPNAYKRRCR